MPTFAFHRDLPYPQEAVFDIVADVEDYPRFLPGWRSARIVGRDGGDLIVEQELGLGALSWRFRTRATFDRPRRIHIATREAPFDHLDQLWRFEARPEGGTRASLEVDYALRGAFVRALATRLFDEGFRRTLQAFEQRAHERLGPR